MTILLGVISGQEEDIRQIKNDVSSLREHVEQRFTSLEERLASVETKVDQVLHLLTTRLGPGQDQ